MLDIYTLEDLNTAKFIYAFSLCYLGDITAVASIQNKKL